MDDNPKCGQPRLGGSLFGDGPWGWRLLSSPTRGTRGRGRPRNDDLAEEVATLELQGKSANAIRDMLNEKHELDLTKGAYRYYAKSRGHAKVTAPRHGLGTAWAQLFPETLPRILKLPKRRGRPREDGIRFAAIRLHREGKSWRKIARELNAMYNENRTPDAYRRLCGHIPPVPKPWRKLDLNLIRAKYSS
jgi:hypothetical protein